MIRVSATYIIEFWEKLQNIATLEVQAIKNKDLLERLYTWNLTILGLYGPDSLYREHLGVSYGNADRMFIMIDQLVKRDPDSEISSQEIVALKIMYQEFRAVVQAEFLTLHLYLLTQKEPFSTSTLMSNGHKIFIDDLELKVPEARFDAQQAARCLVLDQPTACGFHIYRVVESVLRRYYSNATGGKAPPKVRNISVYVNALVQAKKGDERVLAALKQLSNLHRNPLIHPETALTIDEAISVVGMARSITTMMLRELPVSEQNTTTASASLL